MLEQPVGTVDDRDPTGGDVRIDLALHRLPPLRPEPALIGRNRQDRKKLHPAIFLFDDLDLGAWLIEVETIVKFTIL